MTATVLVACTACGGTATQAPATVSVPSRAQVETALLTKAQLPSGYSQTPTASSAGMSGTGPNATCSDFASGFMNDTLPGAAFEIDRDFANHRSQSIGEGIAPFPTTAAAASMVKRFGVDVSYCPSLTITLHGQSATFALAEAPAPRVGTQAYGVTMTATGGVRTFSESLTIVQKGATAVMVSAPTSAEANRLTELAVTRVPGS